MSDPSILQCYQLISLWQVRQHSMLQLKGGVQNLYRCWFKKGLMSMLRPVGNSFSPIKKHASILVGLRVWLNFCNIDIIYTVEMLHFHVINVPNVSYPFLWGPGLTCNVYKFCAQVSCPCRWPLALISQTLWTSLWTTLTRRWMSGRGTLMETQCFTH